jgi:EAL domain-containing protein (putative c-di-GMP-specific phosphodiesterase class I)
LAAAESSWPQPPIGAIDLKALPIPADPGVVSLTPVSTSRASKSSLSDSLELTRHTRAMVERLIADPSLLGPDFTAIRQIDPSAAGPQSTSPAGSTLLGWKATGRGTPGTGVSDTLSLLAEAAKLGLVERLDWAFRCHAFDVAMAAGMTTELHLTPEPETFGSACPPRLAVAFGRGRQAISVAAELHSDAFQDESKLLSAIDQMRAWGWRFVYADLAGTDAVSSAIRLADTIRPAFVQVGCHAVNPAGREELVAAAAGVGASVLALDVDTLADLRIAQTLGATCARGRLIGPACSKPR